MVKYLALTLTQMLRRQHEKDLARWAAEDATAEKKKHKE